MISLKKFFSRVNLNFAGLFRICLLLLFAAALLISVGTPGIVFAYELNTQDNDQPFTFIETECTFVDTSDLLFFSVPPEQLGYRCGYVVLPERHADPGSPNIRLPVAILPASGSNPAPDPLFVVQGGPGGSAFELFPYILPNTPLAIDRDIVMINQRGTQFASPELICSEVLDGITDLSMQPYDEANEIALDQLAECRERLVSEGADLSAYNSLENAHDIEAIRQVLGYDDYNFYGVSYGTLLGLHVMREHPDHLRSVILDGVLPTDLNFITQIPESKQRAFDELFQFCLSDPVCRAEYPDLENRLSSIVQILNQDPVTLTILDEETGDRIDTRLDGDTFIALLFQAFYLDDPYALIPRIIKAAEESDYLFIEQLWSLIAFDRTFSEGMYHSVVCAEESWDNLPDLSQDNLDPTINGKAQVDLQSYIDTCEIWGVDPLPDSANDPVSSQIPTLLLSGKYDPITPPSYADQTAETLANAYNVVDPTGSHSVAFDDVCTLRILQDFLNDPNQPPDYSCILTEDRFESVIPQDTLTASFLAPMGMLDPAFLTQVGIAGLMLLVVLSAYPVWALEWLINLLNNNPTNTADGQRRPHRIGRILVLAYGLLGFIFCAAILVYFFDVLFSNLTYLSAFVLPSGARIYLFIPFVLIGLAAAIVIAAIQLWRSAAGRLWERIYYTLITVCAVLFISIMAVLGFVIT